MSLSANQLKKLGDFAAATDVDPFYALATEKSVKVLVDAGFVECNSAITEGNKVAVRITPEGRAALAPPETEESVTMSQFEIQDSVPVPAIKRVGASNSIYPFGDLEVGQSFFVPATEAMKDPGKSLASTVSSAAKRYATENGTRTINRKNKETGEMEAVEVKAYVYSRKFAVRSVEEEGVKGARVWRVEVEADTADED